MGVTPLVGGMSVALLAGGIGAVGVAVAAVAFGASPSVLTGGIEVLPKRNLFRIRLIGPIDKAETSLCDDDDSNRNVNPVTASGDNFIVSLCIYCSKLVLIKMTRNSCSG